MPRAYDIELLIHQRDTISSKFVTESYRPVDCSCWGIFKETSAVCSTSCILVYTAQSLTVSFFSSLGMVVTLFVIFPVFKSHSGLSGFHYSLINHCRKLSQDLNLKI